MIRTSLFVIATTLLIAIFVFQDRTERKIALVLSVTSSSYHTSKEFFDTPTPDVALTLSKLGFEVIESIEPDRATLVQRMQEFAASLKTADVGLIYYSGNIAQLSGRSYLIPADMKASEPWLFETYGVSIDPLLHEMGRQARHSFVFLNACRLSWSRYDKRCYGLSRIGASKNILVTHANQPTGNKYPHRKNEAVFVKALTANLMKRDLPINQVLRNVYMDVNIATRSEQVPWTENGRGKRFVFNRTKAIQFEHWKSSPPKVASIIPISLEKPVEVKVEQVATVHKAPDIIEVQQPTVQPAKVPEQQKKLSQLRMDKKTAIRVMQKKLTSFSCYSGRIDGIWGRKSKRAAKKFQRRVKISGLTTRPDLELFKAVASYEGPVCGRPCSAGRRRARDGQCLAVEQADLHYIPVIMDDGKASAKSHIAKKIIKKRKLVRKSKPRRKISRLRKKRSKRYRAQARRSKVSRKRAYRKRARRRYVRRKSRRVRGGNRRYAGYKGNPFARISN